MSMRYYMDHHVPKSITQGLRALGVDLITVYEDGAERIPDDQVLERANAQGRILVTQDSDFLVIAANFYKMSHPFCGVIFARQGTAIGYCIETLDIIAKAANPEELKNTVTYL